MKVRLFIFCLCCANKSPYCVTFVKRFRAQFEGNIILQPVTMVLNCDLLNSDLSLWKISWYRSTHWYSVLKYIHTHKISVFDRDT